jgi:hypothetical protein
MLLSVLSFALCAGISALIAALASRRFDNRGRAFAVLSAGGFVLLAALSQGLVVPSVRAWQMRQAAWHALGENRFLATLAGRHPEIRERFAAMMADAVRRGATPAEISARALEFGRDLAGPYFGRYAPQASDASLLRYVTVMVAALDDLGARDPEGCFGLLFGRGTQGSAAAAAISPAHKEEMADAMADVVRSAIDAPLPPTEPVRADALIAAVTGSMARHHGQEILVHLGSLANPSDPGIDRAGACLATREMYREALALPSADAGALLRYLFAP